MLFFVPPFSCLRDGDDDDACVSACVSATVALALKINKKEYDTRVRTCAQGRAAWDSSDYYVVKVEGNSFQKRVSLCTVRMYSPNWIFFFVSSSYSPNPFVVKITDFAADELFTATGCSFPFSLFPIQSCNDFKEGFSLVPKKEERKKRGKERRAIIIRDQSQAATYIGYSQTKEGNSNSYQQQQQQHSLPRCEKQNS